MYRSLIAALLCLAAVSEACQAPPCHWTDAKPAEDYFQKVANVLIAADKAALNSCRQHSPAVTEDHKPTQYKLIYPNPGGDAFEIKVRGRVLLVRGLVCSGAMVADVRVLPAYLEPRGAHYSVDVDKLVITFPYKFDPVVGGGMCMAPDPAIITIPQGGNEVTHNRVW